MEKRLGAILLEGAPIQSLDNCTRDMLCQMTERPLVKTRILGESKAPEVQWRGTLLATGNNVTYAGDMVRRGLTCRLDAKAEVPERREFAFDPHDAVRADRGKYVAAALTIARAYRVSGEKAACPPIGSYGAWSRFAREPLAWASRTRLRAWTGRGKRTRSDGRRGN
jgi:putative DNA primase/helicase